MIQNMKSVQAPMTWGEVIRLAEGIYNRSDRQPIPLSQKETMALAVWFLKLMEERGHVSSVPSDDAIDGPTEEVSQANSKQVGGNHYGLSGLQHWDLVVMFKWDYFQGQITKYLMRWKKKNGVQDLEKAAHFLEKYIETAKKEQHERLNEMRGNR
jgi:hypothetical protein